MKKIIFVVALVCVAGDVSGVTQCVKLDASAKVSSTTTNPPEWTATMSDGTVIRGFSICSDTVPSKFADVADTITLDDYSLSANQYCWCKMTYPAESKWVAQQVGGFDALCIEQCHCIFPFSSMEQFRTAMFGSVQ